MFIWRHIKRFNLMHWYLVSTSLLETFVSPPYPCTEEKFLMRFALFNHFFYFFALLAFFCSVISSIFLFFSHNINFHFRPCHNFFSMTLITFSSNMGLNFLFLGHNLIFFLWHFTDPLSLGHSKFPLWGHCILELMHKILF